MPASFLETAGPFPSLRHDSGARYGTGMSTAYRISADLAALDESQALPGVPPDRLGPRWYLGDKAVLHCLEDWWLTAGARTHEALEAVRETVHGDWVNW